MLDLSRNIKLGTDRAERKDIQSCYIEMGQTLASGKTYGSMHSPNGFMRKENQITNSTVNKSLNKPVRNVKAKPMVDRLNRLYGNRVLPCTGVPVPDDDMML